MPSLYHDSYVELHAHIIKNVLAHPQLGLSDFMDFQWIASTVLYQIKLKATKDCVLEWEGLHNGGARVFVLGLPLQTLISARDAIYYQAKQANSEGCSFGMFDEAHEKKYMRWHLDTHAVRTSFLGSKMPRYSSIMILSAMSQTP